MSWLTKTLSSSIGKKVLMALTGLFLCLFLVVHLIGNLQLFKQDGGYAFNQYAVFMTTFPPIKIISYANYFFILFHAFWGIYLVYQNKKAKGQAYSVNNNQSSFSSRNMGILGTIIFVYIVVHLGDFWYKYHNENLPYVAYSKNLLDDQVTTNPLPSNYVQTSKELKITDPQTGVETVVVKDLYKVVSTAFQNIGLVIFYVLAMVALGFHLYHGFQSAFQTLGINHPKYSPLIKGIGVFIFAILIPIGYACMPLYFYFSK